jgi:hypothetical protein
MGGREGQGINGIPQSLNKAKNEKYASSQKRGKISRGVLISLVHFLISGFPVFLLRITKIKAPPK